MAESVDAAMDAMVPALQDLLSKGIFSEAEVRSIVNRRRQYEYLLRRRQARKADFLAYIEDETKLERLRSLRNRKLLAKKKYEEEQERRAAKTSNERKGRHGGKNSARSATSKGGSSIGDASIVQHIHFIYTRLIRKWRDDVSLHLDHARFAKKAKSWKRLGRIYAEALQVHPRNIALWIEAASHEYFGHAPADSGDSAKEPDSAASAGGSVANARVLLQRGLRVNPRSKDLWLQYFALEFHYIQKLRGRREILQLGLNKKGLAETAADEDDVESSAQIPLIVFKNAIQSIPDDVQFRLKFVELCRMFPETGAIESFIMSTIERDFARDPKAWITRADYVADAGAQVGEASVGFILGERIAGGKSCYDTHLVLDKATDSIRSVEMYTAAIRYMTDSMASGAECDARDVSFLGHLFRKADEGGISSPDLLLDHASYLVGIGNVDSAVTLLHEAVSSANGKYSKDARLWLELSQLIQRADNAGCSITCKTGSAVSVLEQALERIPIHGDGYVDVAVCLLKHMLCLPVNKLNGANKQRRQEKTLALFDRILILSSKGSNREHNIPELCFMYLQHASATGGVAAARKVYESALFKSSYYGNDANDFGAVKMFFDACISMEQMRVPTDKSAKVCLRKLYDSATTFFNQGNQPTIASDYKWRRNHDNLLMR